jgi:site-specific recombinase XerD
MSKQANKVKGVFEKTQGVWYVRYADASGRIRKELAGSKNVAIKLYQKRKTEVLEGKKFPENLRARSISFATLAKDALAYSKVHKLSYRDDEIRMKKLTDWLGERPAASVTPQEIDTWLTGHDKWKPATANRYRALLSLTYKLGMQNGKISCNPPRMVKQRRENNARERYLLPDEETRLRHVVEELCPERLPELDIALNTGMRRAEQYEAQWNAVDFDNRFLTVPRSKHGEKRYVFLNDTALSAFRLLWQFSQGTGRVFSHLYQSDTTKGAREWFENARDKAEIANFHWHDLRHTFASRLVMEGVDIRTVQELMGHKTITITLRYAHLAPTHQLAAVQRLCSPKATVPRTAQTDERPIIAASAGMN